MYPTRLIILVSEHCNTVAEVPNQHSAALTFLCTFEGINIDHIHD